MFNKNFVEKTVLKKSSKWAGSVKEDSPKLRRYLKNDILVAITGGAIISILLTILLAY